MHAYPCGILTLNIYTLIDFLGRGLPLYKLQEFKEYDAIPKHWQNYIGDIIPVN